MWWGSLFRGVRKGREQGQGTHKAACSAGSAPLEPWPPVPSPPTPPLLNQSSSSCKAAGTRKGGWEAARERQHDVQAGVHCPAPMLGFDQGGRKPHLQALGVPGLIQLLHKLPPGAAAGWDLLGSRGLRGGIGNRGVGGVAAAAGRKLSCSKRGSRESTTIKAPPCATLTGEPGGSSSTKSSQHQAAR
jgi:hypothetical protein